MNMIDISTRFLPPDLLQKADRKTLINEVQRLQARINQLEDGIRISVRKMSSGAFQKPKDVRFDENADILAKSIYNFRKSIEEFRESNPDVFEAIIRESNKEEAKER